LQYCRISPGLSPNQEQTIQQVNSTHRKSPKHRSSRSIAALIFIVALFLSLLLVISHDREESNAAVVPETLRIGILPDQDPETLQRRFAPILKYLSAALQIPCELRIPESYEHLLELFHKGEIDLGYFGGYSFVNARQQDRAVPLVMRRIDTRFTSLFLVHANSTVQKIEDLQGKRIGFGSPLSTSGHLMPRYFLLQMKMEPEEYFSHVAYSGAHDKTVYWVRDGVIDVGTANANTVRSMLSRNLIGSDEIRILWETPHTQTTSGR
jgi:phosphonate transport system substrate-binding protein